MKITIEIELGNDEMQSWDNVAAAITRVSGTLSDAEEPMQDGERGLIWDYNGNNVGKWAVS